MKHYIFTMTFILLSTVIYGQEKIPKISGTIKISVENGTLDCDIILSDYSNLSNYLIRLNKGLNILNIESIEPEKFLLGYERELADSLQTYETISYYFPASVRGQKFLPSKLRFRYMGKFPVINDTITENNQRTDWRGNIAFKNSLLRLEGIQTAWYPTIYDIDKDYQYESSTYDIEIICEDCDRLYMNGNPPISGTKAHFKSEIPREPYMFVGKYNVQDAKNISILNADFSNNQVIEFDELNSKIINFFSGYTGMPYKEKIHWVQAYNTSKEKGYFAFASNSTFTLCGNPPGDLKSSFKQEIEGNFGVTIAHEISHYYFGSIKNSNSNLETIINEGFAQFFAIKYWSQSNDEFIKDGILEAIEWFEEPEFKFKPMLKFNSSDDTNDRETYAYYYQTAILFSIEREIGKEKMQKWIKLLLHGEESISDKEFFKTTLKKAVNNDKLYNNVVEKYLSGNSTVINMKIAWEK